MLVSLVHATITSFSFRSCQNFTFLIFKTFEQAYFLSFKETLVYNKFHFFVQFVMAPPSSTLVAQMEKSQELALTHMRNALHQLGSSTESYGDQTLMRFLIARSMDPGKAAKMFVQWQKWRASMVPNGFIPESEIQDELNSRKIYLQGLSKNGCPVMIIKGCKHFPSKDQIQLKKFIVHILDKTIVSSFKGREIGNEKLIGIIDLQKISYKNIDARALITGFQLLQAYYPERLAKGFILHMPWFFVSVWRMVCRFLDKATQQKIVIVTNEEERRDMIMEIGENALPEEYGGQANLIALQDFVLPQLEG